MKNNIEKDQNTYFHSFDFLRLILSGCVVTLHFNFKLMPQGYLAVDLFFIISGFLMIQKSKYSMKSKLINSYKKLYLPYLASIVMFLLLSYKNGYNPRDVIISAFMFQSLGFNDAMINPPTWFVCVFVWSASALSYFFYSIDRSKAVLSLSIISFILYTIIHNYTPGTGLNYPLETKAALGVPVSIYRCLAGVSLGMLAALFVGFFKIRSKILSSAFEVSLLISSCYIFKLMPYTAQYDFVFIFISFFIVTIFSCDHGCVSKLASFASKKITTLYDASIGIFLFHYPLIIAFGYFVDLKSITNLESYLSIISIMVIAYLIYIPINKINVNILRRFAKADRDQSSVS